MARDAEIGTSGNVRVILNKLNKDKVKRDKVKKEREDMLKNTQVKKKHQEHTEVPKETHIIIHPDTTGGF